MRILIGFILLITACSVDESAKNSDMKTKDFKVDSSVNKDTSTVLKRDSVPFIKEYSLNLEFTWTSSYCGGAPPPEEMLLELKKPQSFTNSLFHIVRKEDLRTFEVKSDQSGKSSLNLPVGNYEVYLTEQVDDDLKSLFNPKCQVVMNKIWKKFKVENSEELNLKTVRIQFDFECDPCDPSIKMRP